MDATPTTQMGEPQPTVKVVRICRVAPALPSSAQRMFVSNLDLFWLPVNKPQRLLFYRLSTPLNQDSSIVERLKKSLSSVLVYFYPLAGRLVVGELGRPEIDCSDGGVEFIESTVNIPFDDLEKDEFQHNNFFESLVQMVHPFQQRHENYNTPLLSIQVTAFEGGGICIGSAFNHVLADGNSFWHFMKSWAECSRGLPISKPPHHARTIFNREQKTPVAITYQAHEIVINGISGAQIYKFMPEAEHRKTVTIVKDIEKPGESMILKWMDHKTEGIYSTFCFTESMIADLKNRSGASTSFVAVAAQFWRCLIKAREVAEEENVYFAILADCRGRVKPPLPPTYFGNCLSLGVAKTAAKKLVNEDVCFAAGVIQELINVCTAEEQVYNMIEWLESGDMGLLDLFMEIGWQYGTAAISSHRFPVYEIDYGWGRPLNVQAPYLNEIGSMFFDGAKDGGGSINVSTRLPRNQIATLKLLLFGDID